MDADSKYPLDPDLKSMTLEELREFLNDCAEDAKPAKVVRPRYRQFDLEGNAIADFYDLEEAAKAINGNVGSLQIAFVKQLPYKGFLWKKATHITKTSRKPIEQLDQDGNVIASYSCAPEASRLTGIDRPHIQQVCAGRRRSAGGYFWRYAQGAKL